MNQMEFNKIIGILLLGSTMLVEMYFQNREVEILRYQGGFISDDIIDNLSENIDIKRSSIEEEDFQRLDKYRQRNHDHIADFRVYNLEGETLMHSAASRGQVKIVKYLLKIGLEADIRTRDVHSNSSHFYRDTEQTPLHYAAASGYVDVMRVLVDNGADISVRTESGDTALHKAAFHGHTSAVRWLLEHGSDPEAKNVFGATPLSMALVNQRKEAAVALLAKSKSRNVPPWSSNEVKTFQMLLLIVGALMLIMFKVLNS